MLPHQLDVFLVILILVKVVEVAISKVHDEQVEMLAFVVEQ